MLLEDLLGVYHVKDYTYIAALLIAIYIGIKWDMGDSIGETLFASLFLSIFTYMGIIILSSLLSYPILYIKNDVFNYQTKNEINQEWASSSRELERWCQKEGSLEDIQLCLTSRDYRTKIIDKKINKDYKEDLEQLNDRIEKYNKIPPNFIEYSLKVSDKKIIKTDGVFYTDTGNESYIWDTFEKYRKYHTGVEEILQLMRNNFMSCSSIAYEEDDCFLANHIEMEAFYYLSRNCVWQGCQLKIDYYENKKNKYVVAYKIEKPRLREYETKQHYRNQYMEVLIEAEGNAKSNINSLKSNYKPPDIIKKILETL